MAASIGDTVIVWMNGVTGRIIVEYTTLFTSNPIHPFTNSYFSHPDLGSHTELPHHI
ncbi:MAG: hypothetical protein NWE83_06170 [Candidatus Bathyarchaeota archaeon]|nr:hypothetical protein [Candidatus Bathyarchaeota archaeon]